MLRFTIVSVAALAILPGIGAPWMNTAQGLAPRLAAAGLIVGVLVGVVFFFLALSGSKGMINARLSRDPDHPHDPNAAISMGFGAAGIACSAVANAHYPASYRYFYAVCAVVGLVIALVNAWRYRLSASSPQGTKGSGPSA
ncbi:MAG: hypothetical protein P4L33_06025 [Capsulimonadaceae bacterium]|nr:hypothetical protein [Capsulimonadaceae bacterium]